MQVVICEKITLQQSLKKVESLYSPRAKGFGPFFYDIIIGKIQYLGRILTHKKLTKHKNDNDSVSSRVKAGAGSLAATKVYDSTIRKLLTPIFRKAMDPSDGDSYVFSRSIRKAMGDKSGVRIRSSIPDKGRVMLEQMADGHGPSDAAARAEQIVSQLEKNKRAGPHYNPMIKEIYDPMKKDYVLAHELGHANSPLIRSTAGAVTYGLSSLGARISPLYAGYKGAKGEKLSKKENMTLAAVNAPFLIEESRANAHAIRAMHRMGGLKKILRNKNMALASQLSYMGLAAAPFVVNPAAVKVHDLIEKYRGDN